MIYPNSQPLQEHRKQKQINLNLDIMGGQKLNNAAGFRPFSSGFSKSNATQRRRVSSGSENIRPNHGVLVHDHQENRTKKNVIFSREPAKPVNQDLVEQTNPDMSTAEEMVDINANRQQAPRRNSAILSRSKTSPNISPVLTVTSQSTKQPRTNPPRKRSSSAHHPSGNPSNGDPAAIETRKRQQNRGRLRSRESSVLSDDLKSSQPRGRKGKRSVERLKLRSNSSDSSDSEDSPRSSSRYSAVSSVQNVSPEALVAMEEASQTQKQAWAQFETHVKLIDDSTDYITRQPRRSFNSSDVFQSVMYDMFGNTEYGKSRGFTKLKSHVGNIATYASRFIGRVKALHGLRGLGGGSVDEDDYDEMDYLPSKETIENARRGWKILRQHVQEMGAEKRMRQSTLSWDMLRHTLRGLTNMERARLDLYQRYGLVPIVKSDGTVVQENTMLSERARSALANKPRNPVMMRYNSATTKRSTTYKSIDGFTGYSRSETP